MPPTKRASIVKNKNLPPSDGGYDYAGPDEINIPPDSFDKYIRCFFGRKGSGKSTLVSQFPKAFTWMFEPRRRNLEIRQQNVQKHTAEEIMDGADDVWAKLKQTIQRQIDDPTIETINFDSVDLAYECCQHHICASHSIKRPGEAGKGSSDVWIEIRDEWAAFFDALAATRLGINLVSHMKLRDNEELDGSKYEKRSPSCAPACLQYIKQACDFVMFYGSYNNRRAIQLRDPTGTCEVSAGVVNRFMQPNGKPIVYLAMPDLLDKETGYERLVRAFNNECWDMETSDEEKESPKKKGPPPRRR